MGPPSRFSYAGGKSPEESHTQGAKAGSQPVARNPAFSPFSAQNARKYKRLSGRWVDSRLLRGNPRANGQPRAARRLWGSRGRHGRRGKVLQTGSLRFRQDDAVPCALERYVGRQSIAASRIRLIFHVSAPHRAPSPEGLGRLK